ncbi:TRAP transporter permease [Grimontia marina]|uniref:Sialic acid TRAP transporter permease protein SiaT n=1 Tax=Grimontia marina TaxID=646534 RepID=A0A128FDG5_9GAMM|nr:TRAP transporter fused permease subunit [Grimontia marina]CZF84535.1 Sialic acid TRAP transporter permease protein SiaT [Grimontia marina]
MTETKPQNLLLSIDKILNIVSAPLYLLMVASIIYTAGWGTWDDTIVRVGTVSLGAIILLMTRLTDMSSLSWLRCTELLFVVAVCASTYRYFWVSVELETGLYELENIDIALAIFGMLSLAYLVYKVVGTPLLVVCSLAFFYALFGDVLPSFIGHAGVELSELLTTVWYSFDGVFGRPVAVVTSTILIFIFFGVLLETLGTGDVLLKLAFRLTRRLAGGDAHAAVLASGMFGTISGSAVANVVATGVITIPMIKKRGFSAAFAGGVEAAASSGGQLMPPIMGAVAFIMADVTGIPYLSICLAALIPAIFYYASLFAFISAEAKSMGMKAIGDEHQEPLTPLEKRKALAFVVPLGLIVVLMVSGSSPAQAGFWAVISAMLLGAIIEPQRMANISTWWSLIKTGARAAASISVIVAAVGVIIAVMNSTGLGLRFSSAIQTLADGHLFLSLICMAVGCLILGMGMPTVPAYLIIVLVMGPAVSSLGVETVVAHLFVVYYAVLSAVTPPVALAAFAAAPIANANPLTLSFTSLKLAVVGFIIPFAFVYQPSLLLITEGFSVPSLLLALATTSAAVLLISSAFSSNGLKKIIYILAGLAAISPFLWVQLAGISIALITITTMRYRIPLNR